VNLVVITGRLLSEPRFYGNADEKRQRCNLRIATNAGPKIDGKPTEDPHPMDVVVFGRAAAFISENVVKGQEIHVKGELQASPNKAFVQDGDKQYSREVWGIIADNYGGITFGRRKGEGAVTGSPNGTTTDTPKEAIPF
jgi:single-stranded DNA-binding protein